MVQSVAFPSTSTNNKARPLNILRDLPAVADLIELCFSQTIDHDGRNYLDEMRRSAQDSNFLRWAPRVVDTISLPLSGFVWEEDGRIVGNVSLIPYPNKGKKVFLIANIATHPDYRRRGIAQTLTQMAMERARSRNADALWLHVRNDNEGAIHLYKSLGFCARITRNTWYCPPFQANPSLRFDHPNIYQPRSSDWEQQKKWLLSAYPNQTNWFHPIELINFQPGFWGWLKRLLADIELVQWSIRKRGKLAGVISFQRMVGRTDRLWAAFPEKPNLELVTELLLYVRRKLTNTRGFVLDYPACEVLDEALLKAGFVIQHSLIWMEAPGRNKKQMTA